MHSVTEEARAVSDAVHEEVLRKRGLTRAAFASLARSKRIDGTTQLKSVQEQSAAARARHVKKLEKAMHINQHSRKNDAYRNFRAKHWLVRARVGTQAFQAEERRIRNLWSACTAEERAQEATDAEAREKERAELRAGFLTNEQVEAARHGVIRSATASRLKAELFELACQDIKEHEVWQRGLQIMSSSSGLKPSLVDTTVEPVGFYEAQNSKNFAYIANAEPNPPGPMQPIKGCIGQTWGRCEQDAKHEEVQCATTNMYALMKQWKVNRKSLPLLCTVHLLEESFRLLLTDWVGKGLTILLIEVEPCEDCLVLSVSAGLPRCMTAQRAWHRLFDKIDHAAGDVDAGVFKMYPTVPVRQGDRLAYTVPGGPLHEAVVPFKVPLKVPRRTVAPDDGDAPFLPFGLTSARPHTHIEVGGDGAPGPAHTATVLTPEEPESSSSDEDPEFKDVGPAAAVPESKDDGEEEDLHAVPSHSGLGLCAYDRAVTSRARCLVCEDLRLPPRRGQDSLRQRAIFLPAEEE